MRVLVTGSRDWSDYMVIYQWLCYRLREVCPNLVPSEVTIVSGHCPSGADFLCERAAFDLGYKVEKHPAQWKTYGRAAGFIRNGEMVESGADLCVAFHKGGSRGTQDTIDKARDAGIPVYVVPWQPWYTKPDNKWGKMAGL